MKKVFNLLAALLFVGCSAHRTAAQFIGYTSPQTVTSKPFIIASCTGFPQSAIVPNIGQASHIAMLQGSLISSLQIKLQGSNDGLTFFDISEEATTAGNQTAMVVGAGYYNVVQVVVTCNTGGTFSVVYSGLSVTQGPLYGNALTSQYLKNIALGVTSGTNFQSYTIRTPFGNAAGTIFVKYNGGSGPGGSTVTVTCSTNDLMNPSYQAASLSLATGTTLQTFPIAGAACPYTVVTYNAGGASATNVTIDYVFTIPGTGLSSGSAAAANIMQIGGSNLTLGQKAMANSLPVVLASDQSAIVTAPPATDPCQSPGVAKISTFQNITTATTTALVAVSGSTTIYVCGFDLDITSTTTPSTALLEQGTGVACAAGTAALTPTYTNGTATNSFKSVSTGGTVFKTSASNGLCVVSTVGSTPTTGVRITYVQQ